MNKKKAETAPKNVTHTTDAAKSWREAIESIVIAIVLAFLFRAFEAEAFVIPTGSMAPTLQGRHKDIACPECGYRYRAGASADDEYTNGAVVATTCPMCFYTAELDPNNEPEHKSNTGDRILVNKFAYEAPFGEPQRWDVIVFKYPGNAKQNYIKRLVGLPGETIKIRHGDIFVRKGEDEPFEIARKPPNKLVHMLQLVADTHYLSPTLQRSSWPKQWQPDREDSGWRSDDEGRTFVRKPNMNGPDWLRFRMYPLDFDTWSYIASQQATGKEDVITFDPEPALITDFYAYNAQSRDLRFQRGFSHPLPIGVHWVGDLAIEAEVKVVNDSGKLLLDLVEAGRHYTCSIDVQTGVATLSIDDGTIPFEGDVKHPTAQTRLNGKGSYDIRFANADDQLLLWINNHVVEFESATNYKPQDDPRPATSDEDPGDLAPVGIGADGVELEVDRLRVLRDIYYIATDTSVGITTDYHFDSSQMIVSELSDPDAWNRRGNLFSKRNEVVFKMEEDQFFPLGDNSPYSRDGRLWGEEHYVERDLLIGKAIAIYWPHAWRITIPFTGRTLPLIPNVGRMGLIH